MQLTKAFSSALGKIVGEKSTITCNLDIAGSLNGTGFKFYLPNESGTETSYWAWYHVTGFAELSPVTGVFTGIEITIASGAADTAVASATRAALIAKAGLIYLAVITGATNQVIITSRWPFNATNTADAVPGTGFAFTTTTAGSATVATNMGIDASAGTGMDWVIRPYRGPSTLTPIYLRQLVISIYDSAFTDGTTFGAVAGLTNGISLAVRDYTQTALVTFWTAIKNNAALLALGSFAAAQGTIGYFIRIDLTAMYGGEIPIDGATGQDLCLHTYDNLAGLDGFYATAYGHYTSTL